MKDKIKNWLFNFGSRILSGLVTILIFQAIGYYFSSERVGDVNPPELPYNPDHNPYLGTWENVDAKLYGFPQLIVARGQDNLVYAELFDHCSEPNCSLGKVPAKIIDGNLSANHTSPDSSLAMKMRFATGTDLMLDFKYTADYGKKSWHGTLGFSKVS